MQLTTLNTSEIASILPFVQRFPLPQPDSHKGQNGRGLIIGGSHLFHAASLWAAETAAHFLDIAHYSSTVENNEIFTALKKKFRNGIIVQRKDIPWYVKEDDAILIGPGMVRDDSPPGYPPVTSFEEISGMQDEARYSRAITEYLIHQFPEKRFVLDAGALQMMDPEWLKLLKTTPIITPHQLEFERMFGVGTESMALEEKVKTVTETAQKYSCVILLKAVVDVVSDGQNTYVIEGGNPGLTKGGTGDTLAGLTMSFYAKADALTSAVMASYVLKRSADALSETYGYWYNVDNLIEKIPTILKNIIYN